MSSSMLSRLWNLLSSFEKCWVLFWPLIYWQKSSNPSPPPSLIGVDLDLFGVSPEYSSFSVWHFALPVRSSASPSVGTSWCFYLAHSSGSSLAVFCWALQPCSVHVQLKIHPTTQSDPCGGLIFCVVTSFPLLCPADSNYFNSSKL